MAMREVKKNLVIVRKAEIEVPRYKSYHLLESAVWERIEREVGSEISVRNTNIHQKAQD